MRYHGKGRFGQGEIPREDHGHGLKEILDITGMDGWALGWAHHSIFGFLFFIPKCLYNLFCCFEWSFSQAMRVKL